MVKQAVFCDTSSQKCSCSPNIQPQFQALVTLDPNSLVGVDVDADLADVGVDLADLVTFLEVVPELVHRDLGEEDAVPHAHLGLAPVHLGFGGGDDGSVSLKFLKEVVERAL